MITFARYNKVFAIVPSDTVSFVSGGKGSSGHAMMIDGIYVGGAGNVSVVLQDDTVVTFTAPAVGSIIPIQCKRVNATLTTATLLLAMLQL